MNDITRLNLEGRFVGRHCLPDDEAAFNKLLGANGAAKRLACNLRALVQRRTGNDTDPKAWLMEQSGYSSIYIERALDHGIVSYHRACRIAYVLRVGVADLVVKDFAAASEAATEQPVRALSA